MCRYTTTATKTAVQAFICCRLDYCNSILYGMSDGLLRKVQSIQTAAARLDTEARRCDHVTAVLRQLHWLPVRQRVEYKVACLAHQSLAGQTPAYVADDIQLVTDSDRRVANSPGLTRILRVSTFDLRSSGLELQSPG